MARPRLQVKQSFANCLVKSAISSVSAWCLRYVFIVKEEIMNKKLTILTIMVMTMLIGLPVDGFGASRTAKDSAFSAGSGPQISVSIGQPRRRRMRRGGYWRNGVFYRNYGQYRRSVVGNRRFRTVPRYYWSDGVRRVRYVRVY